MLSLMKDQREATLEAKLVNYRELAREFSEGLINGVIRDFIVDLEQQIRAKKSEDHDLWPRSPT
jgi:hypothetical protein